MAFSSSCMVPDVLYLDMSSSFPKHVSVCNNVRALKRSKKSPSARQLQYTYPTSHPTISKDILSPKPWLVRDLLWRRAPWHAPGLIPAEKRSTTVPEVPEVPEVQPTEVFPHGGGVESPFGLELCRCCEHSTNKLKSRALNLEHVQSVLSVVLVYFPVRSQGFQCQWVPIK